MPYSGIKLSDEASRMLTEFNAPAKKDDPDRPTWIVIAIKEEGADKKDEGNSIDVAAKGFEEEPFEIVSQTLKEKECGYAVFHHVLNEEETSKIKVHKKQAVFVTWADDSASIKKKMKHASSTEYVKKHACKAIKANLQVSEPAEFTREALVSAIKKAQSHF